MSHALHEQDGTAVAAKKEAPTLRELFLQQENCDVQDFEREVLFRCAHNPALVKMLWRIDPDFFLDDLQAIRAAGMSRSFSDCRHEVESFRRANRPKGFLRKTLRARLSGQKFLKLASRLYLSRSLPQRSAAITDSTVAGVLGKVKVG